MDIDLRLLKQVEIDREIPFKELVEIIEAAVVAAFQKAMGCLLYTSDAADD